MKTFLSHKEMTLRKTPVWELKEIAREMGLDEDDAAIYGKPHRRGSWIKAILSRQKTGHRGEHSEPTISQKIKKLNVAGLQLKPPPPLIEIKQINYP